MKTFLFLLMEEMTIVPIKPHLFLINNLIASRVGLCLRNFRISKYLNGATEVATSSFKNMKQTYPSMILGGLIGKLTSSRGCGTTMTRLAKDLDFVASTGPPGRAQGGAMIAQGHSYEET